MPAPCPLVVLENENGQELHRVYTGESGELRFDDVPDSTLFVRILNRLDDSKAVADEGKRLGYDVFLVDPADDRWQCSSCS